MKEITIFTDGAAKGNPGEGGFGVVIVHEDRVVELGARVEHTTNNEMELRAVVEALKSLNGANESVVLYTDSRYVADGSTGWVFNWVRNGWKTQAKEDVVNKALWQELLPLLKTIEIEWHKVPGHVGLIGNERADRIASDFAEGKTPQLYDGVKNDYGLDIDDTSYDEEEAKKRSEARKRQAQKAFSYVSKVDGVVKIHQSWAECEKRVKGVEKVRFKKALNVEEEQQIIQEFGGR